jgi:hypothetical protein
MALYQNNNNTLESEKKEHAIFGIYNFLKLTFKILFPANALIQINRALSKCIRMYPDPWFTRQIRLNFLVMFFVTGLFLGPMILGTMAIRGNKDFNSRLSRANSALSRHEFKLGYQSYVSALNEKKFDTELKFALILSLCGLAVGNFLIYQIHELKNETNRLIKILKNEGVIQKENNNPLVLYTPIGILIDISGSAPKEIAANERIWLAMNIQVKDKDWAEDPNKRSLVFFKTAFKLDKVYKYDLPDTFK